MIYKINNNNNVSEYKDKLTKVEEWFIERYGYISFDRNTIISDNYSPCNLSPLDANISSYLYKYYFKFIKIFLRENKLNKILESNEVCK